MIIHVRVFYNDGVEKLGNMDGQMLIENYKTYAGFKKYVLMNEKSIINKTIKKGYKVIVERLNSKYQSQDGAILEVLNG